MTRATPPKGTPRVIVLERWTYGGQSHRLIVSPVTANLVIQFRSAFGWHQCDIYGIYNHFPPKRFPR